MKKKFMRICRFLCVVLTIQFVFSPLSPTLLMAQDEDMVEEVAQSESLLSRILEALGVWLYPLGLLFLGVIALGVLNALQVTRKKICPRDLKEQLEDEMAAVRVRTAVNIASEDPSVLGRLCYDSLMKVDATDPDHLGRELVEDTMAEFTINENRKNMFWINFFSIIAQAAPMLGLLGTVSGMISAFSALAQTGQADPSQLSKHISMALYTTAFGLIIALPAIFLFYVFKNKLQSLMAECHESVGKMMDSAILAVNGNDPLAKIPEGLSE